MVLEQERVQRCYEEVVFESYAGRTEVSGLVIRRHWRRLQICAALIRKQEVQCSTVLGTWTSKYRPYKCLPNTEYFKTLHAPSMAARLPGQVCEHFKVHEGMHTRFKF